MADADLGFCERACGYGCTFMGYVIFFVLALVLCPLFIAFVVIAGIVHILSTSFIGVFKRILYFINDKSFQLSILVMTTMVGYYQIPIVPFRVYVTLFSALVLLKWLRGRECGILKDNVCYVMYRMNLQWMFRNFSVVGIQLHGCHPVSKIVFSNAHFLIHEGTSIVNTDIDWNTYGVWDPPQLDQDTWLLEPIEFPVDKGPLDEGHEHCYRVNMIYKDSLLRYRVQYVEISRSKDSAGADVEHGRGAADSPGDSIRGNTRGCTDDFIIRMSETQVARFYCYVKTLNSQKLALISTLGEYCHCETMQNVANLIVKGEDFYKGEFSKTQIFC